MYRRFTSPKWIFGHVLVLAAALTCLRLGWWQWDRSQQAAGDAQNLGYALLWPAFAGAFVYMWLRFLRLETIKATEDEASDARADVVLSDEIAELLGDPTREGTAVGEEDSDDPGAGADPPRADQHLRPSTEVTIAVATVGDDDPDDDPELAAYNRALAALAEEDRRRDRRSRP